MNNIDSINNMNDTIDENSNKTDGEDKNEDNDSHIDEEYNNNNRIGTILYEHNPANEITMMPQGNDEKEVNANHIEGQLEDLEAENLTEAILVDNENDTNTTSNNNEAEGVEDEQGAQAQNETNVRQSTRVSKPITNEFLAI